MSISHITLSNQSRIGSETDSFYHRLQRVIHRDNACSDCIVLVLYDVDLDLELTATADSDQRGLLLPYLELLDQSLRDTSVEPPVIPVTKRPNGDWHFCQHLAEMDYPELAPPPPMREHDLT